MNDGNQKIHVLHLIGSTGLYGAERWILALMRAMDTDKFRSTLINLVDSVEERSAVVQAAQQRELDAFDFVTGGKFNVFAALRLARWAKEQKVDIIHGHGFKSDLLGFLTARLAGCRIMTTPHGWSLEKDRKLQLYENLDRFSFRFMDMVCPLSETLYDDAIRYNKGKTRLITNGVDLDEIRQGDTIPMPVDAPFTIGYIGRMVKSKDIETLLRAIRLLTDSGRQFKVILVGDGDQLCELKTISESIGIHNIIEFAGFKSDTASYLKTFDCFVLPSLSEGTPRCIMEAMALKIPVVASDIPGNRLLVSHGETGLLFPVGDSNKLMENIVFIMDFPEQARAMAANGCRKVDEQYSSKKMAREYADVYQEMVAR